MEDAVAVHVVHGLEKLVHVHLDARLGEVVPPPTDELVYVHVHQLEDEREATGRLVIEHLTELDDARVRRKPTQRLNLSQIVHLEARTDGWTFGGVGKCAV